MSQTYKTYLILALILMVGLFVFGYSFLSGVFGGTTINLSLSTTDLEDGLVGHWTFDGGDLIDNATDKSGNGNNGVLKGFTSTTTSIGKIGQALEFDGSDDYVDISAGDGSDFDFAGSLFSVSVWINSNGTEGSGTEFIVHAEDSGVNADEYLLVVSDATDTARFVFNAGNAESIADADSGVDVRGQGWVHLVGVRSGTKTAEIYIDGELKATDTHVGSLGGIDITTSVLLGQKTGGTSIFSGSMDDVRIYNRALSAKEVSKLYELGGTTHINTTISTTDLSDGLVGHWTFDGKDLINFASDASGNGNDGVLNGYTSTTTLIGKIGQALSFDGTDDFIIVSDSASLDITGDLTMSAWVRQGVGNTISYPVFLNKRLQYGDPYNNYVLGQLDTSQRPEFCVSTGGIGTQVCADATNALVDGAWTYVTGVYDGAFVKIYINGVFDVQSVQTGTVNTSNCSVAIAQSNSDCNDTSFNNEFEGDMDDLRLYNRALSAKEISKLYELGGTTHINVSVNTTDLSDGLVGYWTFDGPDLIENAVDKSGSGNTGFLNGFTSTTSVIGQIGQALEFDGSDDYVEIANESNFDFERTDSFSYGAWARTSVDSNKSIFSKMDASGSPTYRGFDMFMMGSAGGETYSIRTHLINTWDTNAIAVDTPANSFLDDNLWRHVFVTYDGSSSASGVNVYIDGVDQVLVVYKDVLSSTILTNVNLRIGARYDDDADQLVQWVGQIDDVRVYNRALSADEVSRLYNLGQ